MKILIIGSTGETGKLLIDKCLAMNYEVTALARDKNKLSDYSNIKIVQGDVLDYPTVKACVEGQDVVLCALGASKGDKVGSTRSKGTENVVNAMNSAGVSRIITVTTIGVGQSCDYMSPVSKFLYPFIVGKERLEEAKKQELLITESNLKWTIVRPPRLINTNKSQKNEIGMDMATTLSDCLDRKNLADCVVGLIKETSFIRKSFTLVGR
jgi:putative NADH-flavin reductase